MVEEVELKLGLENPSDLRVLLAILPSPEAEVVQHNHYYADAAGGLQGKRIMVRIREEKAAAGCGEPDRVLLTVKERTARVNGVFSAQEHETTIDAAVWAEVRSGQRELSTLELAPLLWLQEQGGAGPLLHQGSLMNRRHRVSYRGYTLEIDETTFDDDSVDVEIEVETRAVEDVRAALTALCEENGITIFSQTRGKYARFLSRRSG